MKKKDVKPVFHSVAMPLRALEGLCYLTDLLMRKDKLTDEEEAILEKAIPQKARQRLIDATKNYKDNTTYTLST